MPCSASATTWVPLLKLVQLRMPATSNLLDLVQPDAIFLGEIDQPLAGALTVLVGDEILGRVMEGASLGSGIILVPRGDAPEIHPDLLALILRSDWFRHQFLRQGIRTLDLAWLATIRIPVPSLTSQRHGAFQLLARIEAADRLRDVAHVLLAEANELESEGERGWLEEVLRTPCCGVAG